MSHINIAQKDDYAHVQFSEPVTKMFADIIIKDEDLYAVMLFIANCIQRNEIITIKSISTAVKVERRVMIKKGRRQTFEMVKEYMSRAAAAKAIDNLIKMSLVHVQHEQRLKIFNLTGRGKEVVTQVIYHYQQTKNQKASFHTVADKTANSEAQ